MTHDTCLKQLAAIIDSHPDWWQFPEEGPIRGFLGTDPLFIVGDQPSTSSWDSSDRNRRAFYDLLVKLGASNAHLTDLYKKRGRSGALRAGPPSDFPMHLKLFREELTLLRPTRVVALGRHSYDLLTTHVPEAVPILRHMWHFAYVVRFRRIAEWEANARAALYDGVTPPPSEASTTGMVRVAEVPSARSFTVGTSQHGSQRAIMQRLFVKHDGDIERTITAYANAEHNGEAPRSRNTSKLDARVRESIVEGRPPEEVAQAVILSARRTRRFT